MLSSRGVIVSLLLLTVISYRTLTALVIEAFSFQKSINASIIPNSFSKAMELFMKPKAVLHIKSSLEKDNATFQKTKHHGECVSEHLQLVANNLKHVIPTMEALILGLGHDCGKPFVRKDFADKSVYLGHAPVSAMLVENSLLEEILDENTKFALLWVINFHMVLKKNEYSEDEFCEIMPLFNLVLPSRSLLREKCLNYFFHLRRADDHGRVSDVKTDVLDHEHFRMAILSYLQDGSYIYDEGRKLIIFVTNSEAAELLNYKYPGFFEHTTEFTANFFDVNVKRHVLVDCEEIMYSFKKDNFNQLPIHVRRDIMKNYYKICFYTDTNPFYRYAANTIENGFKQVFDCTVGSAMCLDEIIAKFVDQ